MFSAAKILIALLLVPVVYRLRLHALSHVPGPVVTKISSLFLYLICYLGIEGRVLRYYHSKYGKVVRVAPNSVSIADSAAIQAIYVAGGGFPKDARYRNFNLGPVASIFSSIDTAYRDVRAKAVAPLFATGALRVECGPRGAIGASIADFTTQLRALREARVPRTDLLDLCARLSIDVVTTYLLGRSYGGLGEHAHLGLEARQRDDAKLSANPFVHSIVAFARFSLLPTPLFKLFYAVSQRLSHSDEVARSFARLDAFIREAMGPESEKHGHHRRHLYHERLLAAGISPAEAAAQSKAIVFAGADSTAVMLATTLFHLVRSETARSRLRAEVATAAAAASSPAADTLPFLRACVKEGLRLGMANPTRLTRVVPGPGPGLAVGGVVLPPGTVVGCAAYNLHHDPDVFPEPFAFRPERWMDDGSDGGLRRADMARSLMPFGVGLRGCIGKNLAMQQLHDTVFAVMEQDLLEGARTCRDRIDMFEWFNGDIKGHRVDIDWDY
ncbi:cytochrome P450 [Parachaetomium inaequale]|uniref:Cytochrome P450 n=1 Tax=Parachaetomium inaequale TaxID=2588326 RepID=A0AAN6SW03_9PEZI|nr:cytochrome P450 [Parachaetomium inaequale]